MTPRKSRPPKRRASKASSAPQSMPRPRERALTILAQDPSVIDPKGKRGRKILRALVTIPAEDLQAGPWGYRVQVVDYDATREREYASLILPEGADPYADASDAVLVRDPRFHSLNAYALVMRTLAGFERALGRRVPWGFDNHQLNVVPHAFEEANAYYSPDDHALLFGYFPGRSGKPVFSSLSHDVVVHETTHALVDGLRKRFTVPSSPDQAAFHEGFADVVALLSSLSLPEVMEFVTSHSAVGDGSLISSKAGSLDSLRTQGLFRLAEQFGEETSVVRGAPLRESLVTLWPPSPRYYLSDPRFAEAHSRGEILVAATLFALIEGWHQLASMLDPTGSGRMSRERFIHDGADLASGLLTVLVRALDYTPPVHLTFGDFLSAALTSDLEMRPDDSRLRGRYHLRRSFAAYGIQPTGGFASGAEAGLWEPAAPEVMHDRTHFEPMQSDPNEVFRFLWENRKCLEVNQSAFTRVESVRPSRRTAPDGFVLHEVVAEYYQLLALEARDLHRFRIERPEGMPADTKVDLYGGGTLIFDEYGKLKYHVHNNVASPRRQSERLQMLWDEGLFSGSAEMGFAALHLRRMLDRPLAAAERW